MKVDHARAIRDERYLGKKRAKIEARARSAGVMPVDVLHDDDGSCCRREPWKTTLARLVAPAIAATSGRPAADVRAIITEHEPDIIISGGTAAS